MGITRESLIGIVGPCGAGKTTLIQGLRKHNINTRHIAQEHSYVQDMWKKITNPDLLIYLDVSYINTIARKGLDWTEQEFAAEVKRLEDAKVHANIIIPTDLLSAKEVLEKVIDFIKSEAII